MDPVEQRRKEIEEKRRKLEVLRAARSQKKGPGVGVSSPGAARTTSAVRPSSARTARSSGIRHRPDDEEESPKVRAGTSTSDILDSVSSILRERTAPAPTVVESSSPRTPPSGGGPLNQTPSEPSTTPTLVKRKVDLVVHSTVDMSVAPKAVISYSKEVQTAEMENRELGKNEEEEEEEEDLRVLPKEEVKVENEVHNKEEMDVVNEPHELSTAEKKEILGSEPFHLFFDRASRVVERALSMKDDQLDIFADYAKGEGDDEDATNFLEKVNLVCEFNDDRWSRHRAVTDISWSSKHPELLVASYSSRKETYTNDPDGVVLVWSMMMRQRPEYVFQCQSAVMTTLFNKFSPTVLIGGTYSGQVVLWDTRAKSTPVQRTPLSSTGHTHPLYCMTIVGTQNAHNLVSVSTDGRMCVWSLSMMNQPQEMLELKSKANKDVAVSALGFPDNEVNTFFVGSEEGVVYGGSRHGTKVGVHDQYEGHFGPITGMSFHPSGGPIEFSDLFLTSSIDWTCKLWSHKTPGAPLYSFEDVPANEQKPNTCGDYVYDVRWSPVHPALFASVDGTGSMDLWNLNEDTEVPIIKTKADERALNNVRWSADGRKILTGNSDGKLFVYDVATEVSQPRSDDWKRLEDRLTDIRSSRI